MTKQMKILKLIFHAGFRAVQVLVFLMIILNLISGSE